MDLKLEIAPYFHPYFRQMYSKEIHNGGRGSTKTNYFETKILVSEFGILSNKNVAYVILRKHGNKLRRSVFNETLKIINRLGVPKSAFKIRYAPMEITFLPNNSSIYFTGIDDVDDIKGFTTVSQIIKGCFFEEMTEIGNTLEEIEDVVNHIVATLARDTDSFSFMGAFNPPKRKVAPINQWLEKYKEASGFMTTKTNLYMLPDDYIKRWNLSIMLEEAERLKAIDYDLWSHVYMAEEITPQSATYPNFKRENIVDNNYSMKFMKICVGADTGQSTSANSFVAVGIGYGYHMLHAFKEFYHHNKTMGFLDSQARVKAFFDWTADIYREHQLVINCYIESADAQFRQDLLKYQKENKCGWVIIKAVNKKKRLAKSVDPIEERIEVETKQFGSGRLKISNCPKLVEAFETSERDKNGKRVDDGILNVDSLDSYEYAILDDLVGINNAIMQGGKI